MIRLMRRDDIAAAMRLKQAAGWNQTEQDWKNLLELEPEGCWVDETDGVVAASTTAVCYGRELAWIGMVLVLPEFRGRGLARGLMEHSLRWIASRGVGVVKLDATDMGRPLYQKLGFRDECMMERWGRGAWPVERPGTSAALPAAEIAELDRQSFGADRTGLIGRLLEAFPGQGEWAPGRGFWLGRPGTNAYLLGPGAARDATTARRLVENRMEHAAAASYFWDLLPDTSAVELARELGFERKRQLVRMVRGAVGQASLPVPGGVLAAAGFEYG